MLQYKSLKGKEGRYYIMARKPQKSPAQLREEIRTGYMEKIISMLTEQGEEVLRTGSQQIAIPCVDADNNDEFLVITFSVPTGSRDGDPYDGYSMAQEYDMKTKEKAERQVKAKAEKEAKIARDKAQREAKKKAKEAHLAEKGEQGV